MRALVLALVFVTACGAAAGPGTSSLPPPSPPTAALAAWRDFPANANPRRIIIFNRSLDHFGPSGFSSEPDRKIVWVCNKFVLAGSIRLTDTAPFRASAGPSATYPSIGSARAYSELMAGRPQTTQQPECATSRPFVIATVRWANAGFPTDRGTMTMSAWLFDLAEVDAYLAYSAVDPSAFWGGGVTAAEGRGGRISADGRTVKIAVGNAEPGPCGTDYTASAAESESAVAVAVKAYPHASPGQPVICPLVYRVSYIAIKLKAPVGGRVLLDEKGNIGAACPETGDC